MRNLGRSVLALWVIVMGLVVSAPAQADSVGPYYATPSWDQTMPAATRFIVLSNFSNQAVLDRETGLVWEKAPTTTLYPYSPPVNAETIAYAAGHCVALILGNRRGWRLPSIQELLSLVDNSQSAPALPLGHPFELPTQGAPYLFYQSSTSYPFSSPAFWAVEIITGAVAISSSPNVPHGVWCVRGGTGLDTQ